MDNFLEFHLNRINEINEAKQVGIIYHFTRLKNFKLISNLEFSDDFDCEIFEFLSYNGHLSTTRDFSIISIPFGDFHTATHPIRIAFDGDKLSDKFKIRPINGLVTNDKEIFGTNLNHLRVKHKSEKEEVICPLKKEDSFKLKEYIVEIQINAYVLKPHEVDELVKHLQEIFDKENLKIDITVVRKWQPYKKSTSRTNEDLIYHIERD
jgi:hypothetical protein